jgi:hypothetical protein
MMAKFTRKVEFRAYQFNPEEVKGMDDYAIEDVINDALELNDDIKHAFVTNEGTLYVVFYAHGREDMKDCFELKPGEWLASPLNYLADFEVITDEKFREIATAVQ